LGQKCFRLLCVQWNDGTFTGFTFSFDKIGHLNTPWPVSACARL
jgi:hypothetical protein